MATEVRYTLAPEDIRRIAEAVRAHERRPKYGGGGGFIKGSPQLLRMGKTDAAHTKGYSGVVSLYTGVVSSGGATAGTDSGVNVTAYNAFATLAIAKWCTVAHDGQSWFIIAGEC